MRLFAASYSTEDLDLVKKADKPRDFRIGDVVKLNSGGPSMMVVEVAPDGSISTSWHAGKDEADFPAACLSYCFADL